MERKPTFLPEIQGLRAVAVGLVVIFHLWPSAVPGGYVGVDVFFVISGYLITGVLVRSALRDGFISLIDFYSRRARRLLPVAMTVLAATFAGMFVFLPEARWEETATQIAASALYLQNWILAWLSVDYLGSEQAASPVQHYWSLSIEEQFYFIWPLVMIATLFVARLRGFSVRKTFIIALALIFAASLIASVFLTAHNPAQAYFVTHTRIWELALGGLLALTVHNLNSLTHRFRIAVFATGITAILWSAFAYSPATAFPGVAALVPTFGTVLVIFAGDIRFGPFRGLNARWLSWIGDRSYSIYLWHWPLIVFYGVYQPEIGLMDGIGLISVVIILSHLSYEYIEQRYRHSKMRREWKPLGYAFTSIAACVIAVGAMQYSVASKAEAHRDAADPRYPGPAALVAGADVPDVEPIPALAALKRDLPVVYGDGCHQNQTDAEPTSCILGNLGGKKTIAIMGDSHAAHWVPALERIAQENGWRFVTFTKSACSFSRIEARLQGKPYPSCMEWRENAIAKIKELGVDIVFTSQSRGHGVGEAVAEGMRSVWREIMDSGSSVIAIHDTPWMPFKPGDCLSLGKPEDCVAPRADVEAKNVTAYAASTVPGVRVVDLTNAICGPEVCESVVGNIIVRHDAHHLTATYSAALAPYLAEQAGIPFPAPQLPSNMAAETHEVPALLACEAVGGSRRFERTLKIETKDENIDYRYGDWRSRQQRYDLWSGTVSDAGLVTVTGSYLEGAGGVKSVKLSGRIEDGRLLLRGKRGIRECTLSSSWPTKQKV